MSSRKKLSLGERIALAASGGGSQEDDYPEDIEYGDTSAKVIEQDEDHDTLKPVGRSSLRTKNIQLLDEYDERYSGERVSRKKLAKADGLIINSDDEDLEDDGYDDEDDDSIKSEDDQELVASDDEDVDGEEEDDSEMGSEEDEEEDGDEEEESEDPDEESTKAPAMQTLSLRDKQAEIDKGKATLNQLRIWDSLLEVRIRLQKMLLDCNRLPQTEMYEELISDIMTNDKDSQTSLPKIIEKSQDATKTLIYELIRLQKIMAERNEETKKAISKKSGGGVTIEDDPMNEEITSEESEEDLDDDKVKDKQEDKKPKGKRKMDGKTLLENAKKTKLEEFQTSAESNFTDFIPFRNQTIQKWNDKTQFAGGKFNRKSASQQQISTLKQIEQILSNKDRLIKRTQVKRSNYKVIGEVEIPLKHQEENEEATKEEDDVEGAKSDQDLNPEIFDDDDFYHQLLRELIERKTSNVNDPLQLSHHWLELQKLRTKLKRKVDTRASKGRKIRYDVHAKLVNFMAPRDTSSMSGAAVKELFGSLFGKTRQQEY